MTDNSWDKELSWTTKERRKLLDEKMELLKQDEKKVLQLFFSGTKMRDIAQIMGYGSESYARKKKNYCKNKLVTLMKNDVMFGELAF